MLSIFTYLKNCAIKFFEGVKLSLIGLQAYYQYPRLMLFPSMYGVSIGLLFIAIIALITLQHMIGLIITLSILIALKIIAMVVFAAFSYVLLSVGICYAVAAYCEHKRISFWTILYMGLTKWIVATLWLFVICLVSISTKEEPATGIVLAIVLHMIWSLGTFFIYPIIAFEDLSLFQAIKKSICITWKNLGVMLGVGFSLGLLNNFILSIGFELSPYVITFFDLDYLTKNNGLQFLAIITGIACFLCILFGTVAFIFMSETVVSVIIYRRIHNQPMGAFDHLQPLSSWVHIPKRGKVEPSEL